MKHFDVVWLERPDGLGPILVLADEPTRLIGLGREGPRAPFKASRVVWRTHAAVAVAGHADPAAALALAAYEDEVRRRARTVDLATLWELLVDESEAAYTLEGLAELAFGKASPGDRDALRLALAEDRVYFRERREGFVPNALRVVAENRRQAEQQRKSRDAFEAAVAALTAALEAHERLTPERQAELAEPLALIEGLAVLGADFRLQRRAEDLLARVVPHSQSAFPVVAVEILVRLGVFDPDEDLPVRRHRLSREFPPAVQAETADVVRRGCPPYGERRDWRELLTVSIDDAYTTDIDDAFAIEEGPGGDLRLHVFIADVQALLPRDGLIAAEGARRGATLYHPQGRFPMLPPEVSEGLASLQAGVDRLAVDFAITLDAAHRPLDLQIDPCVVRLDHNLSYDRVDQMLAGGDCADPLVRLLRRLDAAAQALRAARHDAGGVTIERIEHLVNVTAERQVVLRRLCTAAPARRLVSELMILTCGAAGRYCRDNALPAVFRTQNPPDAPFDRIKGVVCDPVTAYQFLRHVPRAGLSTQADRHAMLGLDAYTQVTSPLRRFQDLVMHRQLLGYLRTGVPPLSAPEILAVFSDIEEASEIYPRIEREARRYWTLKHLQTARPDTVQALVLHQEDDRYVVDLVDFGLRVTVHPRHPLPVGSTVPLILAHVDARRDRLSLHD